MQRSTQIEIRRKCKSSEIGNKRGKQGRSPKFLVPEMKEEPSLLIQWSRIIKEYFEQLYAYKFYNLDEMRHSLERCKLSKFIQARIDTLNRHLPIEELESIINNLH